MWPITVSFSPGSKHGNMWHLSTYSPIHNSCAYDVGMEWSSRVAKVRMIAMGRRALKVAKILMKDWVRYEMETYRSDMYRMTSAEVRRVERF